MDYREDMLNAESEVSGLNIPPHSIEAEQSLLGGLLQDNDAWDKVADIVGEEDFYRPEHRVVFRAVSTLINSGYPVDAVTVEEFLERNDQLEMAGGAGYAITLVQSIPSAANIYRYAEIVRERSVVRQLAGIGTEIARNAYNPQGRSVDQLLDEAESKIFQIAESTEKGRQGFVEISEILRHNIEKIDALYSRDNPDEVTGISTGFVDLDKITSGLQSGDLIVVAGRPSMGKTSFAINIAENVAIQSKLPVAVFSLEMGKEQLGMRMLSSVGRIDQNVLKTGRLQDEHWERLNEAVASLSDAPIHVDDTNMLTALEVRARARRLAKKFDGKLGLIVIDYLQMMIGSGRSNGNRVMELGEITRSLKALAKELKVPLIVLSQLSRNVEQRPDKRPMMSDLRESGAIEQDADLIMFMFRDEYYTKEKSQYKGLAECIIGKHRNGPTGRVFLTFLGQFTKFENAAYIPDVAVQEE